MTKDEEIAKMWEEARWIVTHCPKFDDGIYERAKYVYNYLRDKWSIPNGYVLLNALLTEIIFYENLSVQVRKDLNLLFNIKPKQIKLSL